MGKLVGLLSSGIGLVAEASAANRPRNDNRNISRNPSNFPSSHNCRAISRNTSDDPPPYSYNGSYFHPQSQQFPRQEARASQYNLDNDQPRYQEKGDSYYTDINATNRQIDWRQPDIRQPGYGDGNQSFQPLTSRDAIMESSASAGPLRLPVIIPQRRPESKNRGWMLAYAPLLNDCRIDQAMFLDFLQSFNEASKSSPYLDAVNVAAQGVGFAPGITPMIISIAVPVAVKYAKSAQTDTQTNTYLNRMNAQLFEPRGLFAMVMAFKPNQQSSALSVNQSSSSADVLQSSGVSETRNDVDPTCGELQLPPSAPLVFADSEALLAGQQGNKLKASGHFAADYFDRRAQARFAQKTPKSALCGPRPTFRTRFGDPNHPANSGSLISLVSGGMIDRQDKQQKRDSRKSRRRRDSSSSDSSDGSGDGGKGRRKGKKPGLIGSVKGQIAPGREDQGLIRSAKGRMMQTDVLYLMIVNKPIDGQVSLANYATLADRGFPFPPLRPDWVARSSGCDDQDYYDGQPGAYAGQQNAFLSPQSGYVNRQDRARSPQWQEASMNQYDDTNVAELGIKHSGT